MFNTPNNPNKDWPNGHINAFISYNSQLCKYVFSFNHILIRPQSRGTVRLASTNPFDNPLVDFNYYGNQTDFETMRDILKEVRRIYGSQEIAEQFEFEIQSTSNAHFVIIILIAMSIGDVSFCTELDIFIIRWHV